MIFDLVGLGRLPQRLNLMALLPAGPLLGALAKTAHPRRLLQAIARWRLRAVGAIETKVAFKLADRASNAAFSASSAAI